MLTASLTYPLENLQLPRARRSQRRSLAHPGLDSAVGRRKPAARFSPAPTLAFTAIVCGSLSFSVQRPSRAAPKPKGSCSQPDAASVTGPGTGGGGISAISHQPGAAGDVRYGCSIPAHHVLVLAFSTEGFKAALACVTTGNCAKGYGPAARVRHPAPHQEKDPTPTCTGLSLVGENQVWRVSQKRWREVLLTEPPQSPPVLTAADPRAVC